LRSDRSFFSVSARPSGRDITVAREGQSVTYHLKQKLTVPSRNDPRWPFSVCLTTFLVLGTFWLVLGGCGAAVLASGFKPQTNLGIGLVGVSLAFGLTVLTGVYALGAVSGGHFNPAVTVGLWLSRRVEAAAVLPYIVVQVAGAIAGAGVLAVIANGAPGFDLKASGFAANGYQAHSPGLYSLAAAFTVEIVLTAFFVLVILGVTAKTASVGFAGLAIGLALTLIHLISIPVTNTSVNPARSTGPAIFVGGWALKQLWLFWVAPIAGGIIGAGLYWLLAPEEEPSTSEARPVESV
jgi:aquaporin Z